MDLRVQYSACHAGALPSELWPHIVDMKVIAINLKQINHYTSPPKYTQTNPNIPNVR